jgi:RNA polymerase sigma factor (sigma-70 family)
MSPDTNDTELTARLRAGDEHAFTEIYNRYWEKLLAIGFHFTQNKQAAEDIVHDVLTGLWQRRKELRIVSIEAYLATAVKFAVFKSITREKRRRDLAAGVVPDEKVHPDHGERLDALLLQHHLASGFEKLPGKTRLIFHLRRHEELPVKMISQKTDLTPKAVEYHLTKAIKELREALRKIKSFFV